MDGVFDVVGKTPAQTLIALAGDPGRVVSIANFDAARDGVQVTGGGAGDPRAALAEAAALLAAGRLRLEVRPFGLDEAAAAYRLSEAGHVRGKLVLLP